LNIEPVSYIINVNIVRAVRNYVIVLIIIFDRRNSEETITTVQQIFLFFSFEMLTTLGNCMAQANEASVMKPSE